MAQLGSGRTQVREEELEMAWHRLGNLVVELLPHPPGEERDAFEEALDVRIAAAVRQHGRERRVSLRKLPSQLAQVRELVLVVLVEHESVRVPEKGRP